MKLTVRFQDVRVINKKNHLLKKKKIWGYSSNTVKLRWEEQPLLSVSLV